MINWGQLLASGLWLSGLALILAAFSFNSYAHRRAQPGARSLWRAFSRNGFTRLGGLLFCAGMGLTAASREERGLWALLGLNISYEWWRARRAQVAAPATEAAGSIRNVETSPNASSRKLHLAWLKKAADWGIKTEIVWLALLSPFFLFPAPARVLPLLGLPILWVVRRLARGRFIPRTPLDWALCLLMLMVLVSLYATFDLSLSLEKVAPLLFGIGLFYAVVEWSSSGPRLKWGVTTYLMAGTGMAVLALLGAQWVDKLPGLGQITRQLPALLRGLPGEGEGFNANVMGGALLWVLPLQFSLFGWSLSAMPGPAWRRWAVRFGLLLALLLSASIILLSQSRNALISLALGLLLLLWLVRPTARPLLVAALVAAAAVTAYVGPQRISNRLFVTPSSQAIASGSLQSVQDRVEVWSRAIYGIEDFPFTGMGMGTFYQILPMLYPISSPELGITHAHNQFLQAGLDLGLPGLVAYLAIWMLAGAMAVQTWRGARDGWSRAAAAGIAAGLFASFVFGLADAVVMVAKPGIFFWGLLGLLTALWIQTKESRPPSAHNARQTGQERDRLALGKVELPDHADAEQAVPA